MNKAIWVLLSFVLLLSMTLTSCSGQVTTTSETMKPSNTATTATSTNWWDKFGEPEYGGTLIVRYSGLTSPTWDPAENPMEAKVDAYFEGLFCGDWTLDRSIWAFQTGWMPSEYCTNYLAEDWEQTDPLMVTVYIRQGVYWQDKPPVNGRELTADDVQYSYDRILGTGNGFTEPNPFYAGELSNIAKVVAIDRYTVQFQLKEASPMAIYQIQQACVAIGVPIVAREWVEQGDRQNWENAVGTGPWILSDFVSGSQVTYTANPNYWGHDERHPDNQLPYVSTYKRVSIEDISTAEAALRAGRIDMIVDPIGGVSWREAASLAESNSEIQQAILPSPGFCVDLRCDKAPFTDINVRKALQLSLNLEAIAASYYGGTVDGKPCGVVSPLMKEWITTYDEWPDNLKAEYGYDPEAAKTMLTEAGYPDGFSTKCLAANNADLQLLQVIQTAFKDINVDMEIESMDMPTFWGMVTSGKHEQMAFNQLVGFPVAPDKAMLMRGSGAPQDNYTFNNDSHYEELISQFSAATTEAEARAVSKEADLYLLRQHWAIQTFPLAAYMVWQPYVKGYSGELLDGALWPAFCTARMWIDQSVKESLGR